MAAKGSAEYERGLRNGKTDASLEGLALALDEVKDIIKGLPCRARGLQLATVAARVKIQYWLLGGIFAGMGALVLLIMKG